MNHNTTYRTKPSGQFTVLRRFLLLFVAALMAVTTATAQGYSGGSGTQADPYLISSVANLQALATTVNSGTDYSGVYFKLTANLDLGAVCRANVGGSSTSWSPIGKDHYTPFKGHFDGNNHTISKLYIKNLIGDYQGLFGYIEGASIDSLQLMGTNVKGKNSVGSVCGYACSSSSISYCTNSGSVSGSSSVGGVCGIANNSTISYCTNSGSVSGTDRVGGVCGNASSSTITYCYYDKQMCVVAGINGSDVAGQAEGKLTTELVGTLLSTGESGDGWTAEHWTFAAGLYPRPKGIENTHAAIVAAAPILLAATNATQFETVNLVTTNFLLGTADGLQWTSNSDIAMVQGDSLIIKSSGSCTLTATLANASKTIVIKIPELGTEKLPLIIASLEEFVAFRDSINANSSYKGVTLTDGGANKYFKLTANLDLGGVCGANVGGSEVSWAPIGIESKPFKGHFNGDGHTISNLYINNTNGNYQALFGYNINATIKNLNLTNVNVNARQYVAGVAGYAKDTVLVENCSMSGSITASYHDCGGICGYTEKSAVSDCSVYGTVSAISYVGGIVGTQISNTITKCVNLASVTITGDGIGEFAGGMCGYSENSKILLCSNGGSIKGKQDIGGIAGKSVSNNGIGAIVQTCANSGLVEATTQTAGGIIGANEGELNGDASNHFKVVVSNCLNYGQIVSNVFKGGVVGYCNWHAFSNCYTDKQMCTVSNTVGTGDNDNATINQALTSELTNGSFFNNAENWSEAAGRYPIPAGLENNPTAQLIAASVQLHAASSTTFDKCDNVTKAFIVNSLNGVQWTSSVPDIVQINGNSVNTLATGTTNLTATIGSLSRIITINVTASAAIGTENNPLIIASLDDLLAFRNALNNSSSYKGVTLTNSGQNLHFVLWADIDLSSVCNATDGTNWTPINPFKGYFDGNGHIISNLYINASGSAYQGLFGYISGAEIKNLSLSGVNVTGNSYVGGVCGLAHDSSTISHCLNSGSVSGTGNFVGGVCGSAGESTITSCLNSGSVNGTNYYVGGVCGLASDGSTISHCLNSGSVNGTESFVGGVCGSAEESTITSCLNSGSVNGTNYYVGGVCGCNNNSTIADCYYDKQMCALANGIGEPASSTGAEGKLTTEMLGDGLKTTLGDISWEFVEGMYPRPKGIENTHAAIVAATPIMLNATSDTQFETVNRVTTNFLLGTADGLQWTSSNSDIAMVQGDSLIVKSPGNCTLTATLANASKTIVIKMPELGTEKLPLIITSLEEFVAFRDSINANSSYKGVTLINGGANKYFKLTADIDLGSINSWTPVGGYLNPFKGNLNGNGHTISNLKINSNEGYQGLFGRCNGGSISNINLINAQVTGGADYTGGLVGYNFGKITSCFICGSINGENKVGGIAGYNSGVIQYTSSSASVNGQTYVGGIVGKNDSHIYYSINSGNVSAKSEYAGGITGSNSKYIIDCSNSGNVSGSGVVGGVAGLNSEIITRCISTGSVNQVSNSGSVVEINNGTALTSNYYDKQMCTVGGENGTDVSGQAEGKLTTEMLGDGLKTTLGDISWEFVEGMYPRPKGIENTHAAIVAATPIMLNATSDTQFETVNRVTTNFLLGTADGLQWTSNSDIAMVQDDSLIVKSSGNCTLTATLANASKTIVIKMPELGTENFPLIIASLEEFVAFRNAVNANSAYKGVTLTDGGESMYFKLTADIDLSSVCGADVGGNEVSWTPIGTDSNRFKGHFDGDGHTISNLYINAPESSYQALFGYLSGAEVKNLSLSGVNVTGQNYVGGVCGRASSSTISHCLNNGNVNGTSYVGGVCGRASSSTISHCLSAGSVSGSDYVGGVCGWNDNSTIADCYYDKQMCALANGIGEPASSTGAEGKLTTDMVGDWLKTLLGETYWTFTAGLYPRLKGSETTDAAIVGATPVFLANGEKANAVASDFTVGTDNGVTWTKTSGSALSITGGYVTVVAGEYGACVLTATRNGFTKNISLVVPNTAESPITIDNLEEFQTFRDEINTGAAFTYKGVSVPAGGESMYFKLTADLDLGAVCGANVGGSEVSWASIGNRAKPFKGHFDGDGHTISNLYINAPEGEFKALFGYLSGAEVKNLSLSNVNVTGGYIVGGVCGMAYNSTISHSLSTGSVSGTKYYVGGVCGGANNSTISNCFNSGSVNGGEYVGGVCGYTYNSSTISYCLNSGSVNGTGDNVGGVCGYNDNGTNTSCYYDKQMCSLANGIGYPASSTGAEGKLTTEMLGDGLKTALGETNWTFTAGLYPRLKGSENTDAAIVRATPVFLYVNADDNTVYDNANAVSRLFTVNTSNSVEWSSSNNTAFVVEGGRVLVLQPNDTTTLNATLNGITKAVTLISAATITPPGNSESAPLTINSVSDLANFSTAVNDNSAYKGVILTNGGSGMYFELTADLDLSSVCGKSVEGVDTSWTPIGIDYTHKFKGHFNGGNHTISNLYINNPSSSEQGLFGNISGAEVKNLSLADVNVTGRSYVGGVCGIAYDNSTISGCTSSGSVSGNIKVGGVCGSAWSSTISHCLNSGSVTGDESVGGVCGYNNNSTIADCYYDKQMCALANGIGYPASSTGAQGKLTTDMVGDWLKTALGETYWTFTTGLYPRPKGSENTDAAIVAATPVFLYVNADDNTVYDNANAVSRSFTVNTSNSVEWSSSNNTAFEVGGGQVLVLQPNATTTLNATLNGITKSVTITSATTIITSGNSESDPLTINSVSDLANFRTAVNANSSYKDVTLINGGANKYFKLTANLDLSSVCGANVGGNEVSWTPIGASDANPFKGHFDGDGHTISKLYINAPEGEFKALFGYLSGAEVKNLSLSNVNVTGGYIVGGVCGVAYNSTISHCLSTGSVNGIGDNVGGVCGAAYNSTISHCLNSGSVNGISDYVGGVCGYAIVNSTISHCLNSGSVNGTGDYVGGVCGNNDNGTITSCLNSGSVTGDESVGGVCGYNNNSTIADCYYDKQMCALANGIGEPASSTGAEGKLTTDMVGDWLKTALGETYWTFTTGLYPRPKDSENTDAAIVAATPVFLANEENANAVASDFTVGTSDGATWSSTEVNGRISLNGGNAAITNNGDVTLTLTKGTASKNVKLTLKKNPVIAEIPAPAAVEHGGSLALTTPTVTDYGTAVTGCWKIETTTAGTFTNFIEPYTVRFADNNKRIRYKATNELGTIYSNEEAIAVTRKQLTATDPVVTTSKVYDGTADAEVTAGTLENEVLGDDVTLSATASYDNANVGTSKTITVVYAITGADAGNYTAPVNFTTTGEITPRQHIITASADANGTITPSGEVLVNEGANQVFTITANAGYEVDVVLVDNVDVTASLVDGVYTFTNVTANHTISVTFKVTEATQYTITATAGANGTITPSGEVAVNEGANQAFTITANAGYEVDVVLVDDVDVTASLVDGVYTFTSVTANHTISATFKVTEATQYTITASAGENGTITPNGEVSMNEGASQAFTIAANAGYEIDSVLVDGIDATASLVDGVYTFTNVTANHTIHATFKQSTGIDDNSAVMLTVYPNPTTNGFYCNGISKPSTLKVYSITGKLVLSQPINENVYVDINHLSAGIYIVSVDGNTARLVKH